jgi:hypothetical protein
MKRNCLHLAASAGFATLLCASPASAQIAPSLGSAQSFALFGGATVGNTGSSIITGDVGDGETVTGFPPGLVVSGRIHDADAAAVAAQNSVTTARDNLASQACTQFLSGQDLGGKTLTPGVYCFFPLASLTGTLTLNGQGNANAVFIFHILDSLRTGNGSSVVLINGASPCNVFWEIGKGDNQPDLSSLGTNSAFAGNILFGGLLALGTGASLTGRALGLGNLYLDTSNVTAPCLPPQVSTLPAAFIVLLALGLTGVGYFRLRRRARAE